MLQFDAFENPNPAQRQAFPYFVVLQSDQLDHLNTRLCMPLTRLPEKMVLTPWRLTQTVQVRGEDFFLAPQLLAALPPAVLKHPVASLRADAALFVDALDAVISGV